MKELKFRAWDKIKNRMCHIQTMGFMTGMIVIQFENEVGEARSFDDVLIEQYCGVQDDYKTDIYEGDIIEDVRHGEKVREFTVIDIRTLTKEYNKSEHSSKWKVIDNIHDKVKVE